MVIVEHQLAAYLRGQQVARFPFAPVADSLAARFPLGEDVLHPALVAYAVEVGVGLVNHFVPRLLAGIRLVAVLHSGGDVSKVVFHIVSVNELLLQLVPLGRVGTQREGVGEEVVGRGVLVHAPYEVGDGVEEMLLLHHRGVEDDVVAQFLLCAPYVVGHALQHLEAEAVLGRLVFLGEQVGVRDGKQVVRCHAYV